MDKSKKIEVRTFGTNYIKISHDPETIYIKLEVDIEEILQEFTMTEIFNNLHKIERMELYEKIRKSF